MRTLIRAAVVLAGAAGLCFALSTAASADVVEPKSALQPTTIGILDPETVKAAMAVEPKQDKPSEIAEATPAPEQVVRPAPAHLVRPDTIVKSSPSVVERVVTPFRVGLRHIGASLGRVVSACEISLGSGVGGPALVFAVIAMATPFVRRRVVGTRWSTDEDVPDFLYAWELTPPG